MIICLCHRVSKHDFERAARHGRARFDERQQTARVGNGCAAHDEHASDLFPAVMACRLARVVAPWHLNGGVHA